jgi:UDP-glucose:glycoprotein glucosyltransferase
VPQPPAPGQQKNVYFVLFLSLRLPRKRVLTLNLELPESWLVEPVMALHDLDNLRLADIPEQVSCDGV